MNIIVGATGQVGSNIISCLKNNDHPVRAVVKNPDKLLDKCIEFRSADLFDVKQLTEAFKDGTTVFILTPENPTSNNVIEDTKRIVDNYKTAIQATSIKKVVALSCIGAHVNGNTGNILMSRILEQGLEELDIEKVFVRPSYYFSNWLRYIETVEQFGILPTFFPENMEIEMHSPLDLAKFIAEVITDRSLSERKKVYELTGRQKYSSYDVSSVLSRLLNREVTVQTIPEDKWKETLLSVGFTEDTASHLSDMTQAVIDNIAVPEQPNETIKLSTTLEDYFREQLKKSNH